MDAACTIQDSIHVFSLVRKYVSRILGTYHSLAWDGGNTIQMWSASIVINLKNL